jgi:aspartate aminotransferase-like enzyme
VCIVHNETSTGATSRVGEIRAAMDRAGHPALLLVDTISSLASIDYRHDEWGVDVTIAGSQKGLMLPPGLSFNAVSDKAHRGLEKRSLPRAYWDWEDMRAQRQRLLPLHAGHQPALRPRRGHRHAARGGPRQCLRPPPAPFRSHAARRAGLGA